MPLPKAPGKPATILEITPAMQARATRPAAKPPAPPATDPAAGAPVAGNPVADAAATSAPVAGHPTGVSVADVASLPPVRGRPMKARLVMPPVAPHDAAAASAGTTGTVERTGRASAPAGAVPPSPTANGRDIAARPAAGTPAAGLPAAGSSASPSLVPSAASSSASVSSPSSAASPAPSPAPAARAPQAPRGRGARSTRATTPQAAAPAPVRAAKRRAGPPTSEPEAPKLFVLDTNVLMHDPTALFRFAEHDIFLPMMTLEELDNHKRGMSEVARNARSVSRTLDELIAQSGSTDFEQGVPLSLLGNADASGRLFFQTQSMAAMLPSSLPVGKADNQILGVVRALQERHPGRETVLVSKDINMRIKARTLGLAAEDYFNDQVLEDTDLLYSGMVGLPPDFWDKHGKGVESWQQAGSTFYRITGPMVQSFVLNEFVWLDGDMPLAAQVKQINGRTAVLQTLRDYAHLKNAVWGITARNREQNFALNLLMNPEIDFVSLLGQAGTGKTLLALAAGLAQTIEGKRFSEIIMTRATVPVGEDIGYLPGTEEEKMQPWMGALEDNLEVLNQGDSAAGEWGRQATNDIIRSRVKVKALSFMRGRTFINKFLIIDEAQNLTPKQMKTLVTRAGPGTKVICLGNIAQIDTPYLTEGSSGLTYVVDRFKGWAHAGHVTLQRGERSRLADFAADVL